MTNAIEKVSPVEFDGIEFYCSANGEETGMSHRGLFKFVGVPRTTGQRLIGVLDGLAQHMFPKSLERWNTVSIFHDNISGVNDSSGAQCGRILKAEFCADFCSYVAYEYNGGNKIARNSLNKFATIGIKNFIQELTGYSKATDSSAALNQIMQALTGLTTTVNEMKIELASTSGYRKARVTYPGVEKWLTEFEESDVLCLPDSDQSWYTIDEALMALFPSLSFTKGNKISIGMMVAATWKSMHMSLPTKVVRENDKGQRMAPVAAYPNNFLPVVKNNVIKFIANID